MKNTISYKNLLTAEILTKKLKKDLPNRFVRKNGKKTVQVARRKITYQRTWLILNLKTNTIKIKTMWDDRYIMILAFGIFWWFIYNKKRKQGNEEIQAEVETLLNKYHNEI